jgi:polysaccharide export outer membrane protein
MMGFQVLAAHAKRFGFTSLILLVALGSSRAEYRLDSGDTLEVYTPVTPNTTIRTTVDPDGNIAIPVIGVLHAAGSTLVDVQGKLDNLVDRNDSVRGVRITVALVECRPFYINGDVAKSGAYPYRPALTVRQAIALAGGLDSARVNGINPLLAIDLRGEYGALWIQFFKQQAHVLGLKAEIAGTHQVDFQALHEAPIPHSLMDQFEQLELDRLSAALENYEHDKKFLNLAIQLADGQVQSLEQEQANDETAVATQAQELASVVNLNRDKLATNGRLFEEQRGAVLLKSQQLHTISELAKARLEREHAVRQLQQLDDSRATQLRQLLQDAVAELEKTRMQLRIVDEKLGGVKTDSEGPQIVVYRRGSGTQARMIATEDSEVQPGDVMDITIPQDRAARLVLERAD